MIRDTFGKSFRNCVLKGSLTFEFLNSYIAWHGSSLVIPMKRTPKLFKLLSSKACKMFRKFLEPNKDRRPKNVSDLQKFIDDRWLAKGAEKNIVGQYMPHCSDN